MESNAQSMAPLLVVSDRESWRLSALRELRALNRRSLVLAPRDLTLSLLRSLERPRCPFSGVIIDLLELGGEAYSLLKQSIRRADIAVVVLGGHHQAYGRALEKVEGEGYVRWLPHSSSVSQCVDAIVSADPQSESPVLATGTLQERSLFEALWTLCREESSATLYVVAEEERLLFRFYRGELMLGRSNQESWFLGRWLLSERLIPSHLFEKMLERQLLRGGKQGQILVDLGVLSPERSRGYRSRHLEALWRHAFALRNSHYILRKEGELSVEDDEVFLSLPSLMWSATESMSDAVMDAELSEFHPEDLIQLQKAEPALRYALMHRVSNAHWAALSRGVSWTRFLGEFGKGHALRRAKGLVFLLKSGGLLRDAEKKGKKNHLSSLSLASEACGPPAF